MQPFSGLSLLIRGLSGQRGWTTQWRSAEPKAGYDALIVGGGGHGLGAALPRQRHRLTKHRGAREGLDRRRQHRPQHHHHPLNYLFDESAALYDHAVRPVEPWRRFSTSNVMFSQRGVMMLAHTVHDARVSSRHVHANRVNGVDNEWLTPA